MKLFWNKCQGDVWCSLNTVNLEHSHFDNMDGVYIIWHGGANAKTVKVGQGFIRDRLRAHRIDSEIQAYKNFGLFVTWTHVSTQYKDSVEKYLGDVLKPVIAQRFPAVIPEEVNLPW